MKKNVSKLLVAVMVLAMALGLVACSGGKADSKYVGSWKATQGSAQGITIDLAQYNLDMSMELKADGTVSVALGEQQGSGTWSEAEGGISISSDGETLTFKENAEGKLEYLDAASGATLYFEKQAQ